jgi:hypothetical protein
LCMDLTGMFYLREPRAVSDPTTQLIPLEFREWASILDRLSVIYWKLAKALKARGLP